MRFMAASVSVICLSAGLSAGAGQSGRGTPALPATDFARLRFGMVLYANAALQGAVRGMANALSRLQERGILEEDPALVATFSERQRLVQKDLFDELEARYRG